MPITIIERTINLKDLGRGALSVAKKLAVPLLAIHTALTLEPLHLLKYPGSESVGGATALILMLAIIYQSYKSFKTIPATDERDTGYL